MAILSLRLFMALKCAISESECQLLIWVRGHWGSSYSKEAETLLSPAASTLLLQGIPRCSQASQEIQSLQCVSGLPWGVITAGHVWNTSPGRHHGQYHLNWLFSTRKSSGSTLSSLWMSERHIHSPKLSPATVWVTSMSGSSNCNHFLLVIT